MLGKIQFENFAGLHSMPQDYASAWTATGELVGASYKPLLTLGKQVVKGTNYYYLAEQTLITNPPLRRIVLVVVNEFAGKYELVAVEEILG